MAEYYVVRDTKTGLYFRGKGVNKWGKYYNQASIYRIKAHAENTVEEESRRGAKPEVVPIQIFENTADVEEVCTGKERCRMTCKDCVHYEVCPKPYYGEKFACNNVEELCKNFKNKADFVEVVRCKDCKYLYCFSAIDRQFYCKHYPKGLQGINIVEENPFCSYGERRDT